METPRVLEFRNDRESKGLNKILLATALGRVGGEGQKGRRLVGGSYALGAQLWKLPPECGKAGEKEHRPSERARGTGLGVPQAGQGIPRGQDRPALLWAQRVGTGGQMFPPPSLVQACTCQSWTKDLKAPGAQPEPVPPGVTVAF